MSWYQSLEIIDDEYESALDQSLDIVKEEQKSSLDLIDFDW